MPHRVRSSCRNDYLLCVWSRERWSRRRAKSVGDSYGRALAATPSGLAGDWIDRTALAACWL